MKKFGDFVRGKAFEVLFFLLSLLSVFYVADRMGKMSEYIFFKDCRLGVFVFLMLLMGYMLVYTRSEGKKKSLLNFHVHEVCSFLMCFLLYLILFLWFCDGIRMILPLKGDWIYGIPVIASVVVTIYGFFHAKKLYIKEYKVPLRNIASDKKVLLLSDVHAGTFVDSRQLKKIVSEVNRQQADMIFIAGDMFDVDTFDYCNRKKIAEILRQMKPEGKIYAVLGNHDPSSSSDKIRQFYQEARMILLEDEGVELEDMVILGRDDVATNPCRISLENLWRGFSKEKPVIVLDHNPLGILEAQSMGVDLILCGHTHKGQFFPANIFTKMAYGKRGYYGHFQMENTQSVVSSGVGYFQMPMRVGSNSEIVVLHLRKSCWVEKGM